MSNPSEFPATGRVLAVEDEYVMFQPLNSTYEWKLLTAARYGGPVNQRIECVIRLSARKVYTVPSGGNFVSPIIGPPRIVQGRIKHGDERTLVVHATVPIVIELPADERAIDLTHGPLAVGAMVNVVALPGARFEAVAISAGAEAP
jgi:hypothetical protein